MLNIKCGIITVGKAFEEGRTPNHDGEYLSVYYVPGGEQYIVEDNAGVTFTYCNYDDVARDSDQNPEVLRWIEEAEHIRDNDTGETAVTMGVEGMYLAIEFGWATKEDFDGNYIIGN